MKKNFNSTLVLLAVFASLTAWYFLYEKKYKVERTEKEEKEKQLLVLTKDQIQELEIARLKKGTTANEYETLKFKKLGNDWNLLEPLQDSADSGTLTDLIANLTTTKQERVVEEKPSDLEPFGLKHPQIKVTVRKDASSQPEILLLGADTPVGHSLYAQTSAGTQVFRVTKTLRSLLEKEVKAFRNKSVLGISRFEIGEVEFEKGKETFLVKKDDKDNWSLARSALAVDNAEWTKTLNAIVDAKAKEFPEKDPKGLSAFGLTSPALKIRITKTKENTKALMLVGLVKDKVYSMRDGKDVVYELDKDFWEKVARPEEAYRNRNLAQVNRFDVKRIRIERGTEELELTKEGTNWKFPGDPTFKVDNAKVDSFLVKLQDTKIQKFLPATALKTMGKPEVVIRVFEKKEKEATEAEKLTLKFTKAKNKEVTVERSELGFPFTVKEDDLKVINLAKPDFQQTEPPKDKPEAKGSENKKS